MQVKKKRLTGGHNLTNQADVSCDRIRSASVWLHTHWKHRLCTDRGDVSLMSMCVCLRDCVLLYSILLVLTHLLTHYCACAIACYSILFYSYSLTYSRTTRPDAPHHSEVVVIDVAQAVGCVLWAYVTAKFGKK